MDSLVDLGVLGLYLSIPLGGPLAPEFEFVVG
jgi:hypothetical protein